MGKDAVGVSFMPCSKPGCWQGRFWLLKRSTAQAIIMPSLTGTMFQQWFTVQFLRNIPPAQSDYPGSLSLSYGGQRCGGAKPDEKGRPAAMADGARDRMGRTMAASTACCEEMDRYRDKKPLVEMLAEDQGHKVLFLPVHHPELNPIELVWATVKHYCGTIFSNSTSFKEQRQHLEESFGRDITPKYCAKVYEHVQHIEERYWTDRSYSR